MKVRGWSRVVPVMALSCLLGWSSLAIGQENERPRGPRGGGGGPRPAAADAAAGSIKPYAEVITEKAETKKGLFTTHKIGEKLFYEIPADKLGKDMLWVTQIDQTQAGYSFAGMPVTDRVVRWELRGDNVLLRDVKYAIRADVNDPIKLAVQETSVAPIIKVFPVAAYGTDKKPVIDVTELFTTDVSEISARETLNVGNLDSRRTFIEQQKAFPGNIETKILATYAPGASQAGSPGPGRRGGDEAPRDRSQSGVTAVIHHSMQQLPEAPMTPRRYDPRVGFFTVRFDDFGNDQYHQVETVRLITRWRLEKKDPNAEVSEPVKPIVFYVAREVPDKWKPYVQKGIEMWQPAFEKAGFKNAIIGKQAPSPQDDPDWDPEDARISTIRWLPSSTENAFGPHVHDPRTGEILEADVRIYHNVLKLARDWYFVQASPNDPRAQQLPLPDELVGELLAYIVAHEVGHSLGFPHNMKASSAFSVANLRNKEFTAQWGTEASIMDYGRFNYVAQPEDGATLIPKIGPYDFFGVEWGYKQYATPDAEKEGLKALFAKQISDPLLRFGDADPSEDPTRQTEDLGGDTVEATELGMKNIDRIADYLVKACCKPGEDYDLLRNMYDQVISQRTRELNHVTAVVGGFEQINLFYGDAEKIYHPISPERQRAAVKLLVTHAFATPTKLVNPDITMRLETNGAPNRILGLQRSILNSLLSSSRINRMTEHGNRAKGADPNADVYSPTELISDLRKGILAELIEGKPSDIYRRNLQRLYVDVLGDRANSTSSDTDLVGLCRAELLAVKELAKNAATEDAVLKAHYAQLVASIDELLDPSNRPAPAAPPAAGPPGRGGVDSE